MPLQQTPSESTNVGDNVTSPAPMNDIDYLFKQMNMLGQIWPTVSETAAHDFPDFAKLYNQIFRFRLPNFIGAKIQVHSALNLDQWDTALQQYHDKEVCEFLRYGWPLGYLSDVHPASITDNHASAMLHEKHITKFIQTELEHNAILGPFHQEPFTPWTRCSPLMTRPKKDSDLRRVIVDLSYPKGQDVNSSIDISSYLGRDISFKLPTISDLVAKLQMDGPDAYIWKADLCRAY